MPARKPSSAINRKVKPHDSMRRSRTNLGQAIDKAYPVHQCRGTSKQKKKRLLLGLLADQGVTVENPGYLRTSQVYQLARDNGINPDDYKARNMPELQCGDMAIPAGATCYKHGGAAPRALLAAKARIWDLVDPALGALLKVLIKSKNHAAVVAAAKDILDRNGLKEAFKIEITDEGHLDLSNLDLLGEEELHALAGILRKLKEPPKQLAPGAVRDVTQATNVTPNPAHDQTRQTAD